MSLSKIYEGKIHYDFGEISQYIGLTNLPSLPILNAPTVQGDPNLRIPSWGARGARGHLKSLGLLEHVVRGR